MMMSTDQSFVPDFARVENDALAGQLLASFWQPIALSQNYVAGKARRIKILGTQYTLYRGADGHMRLVQDRCPHRGTSLAYGWDEGVRSEETTSELQSLISNSYAVFCLKKKKTYNPEQNYSLDVD